MARFCVIHSFNPELNDNLNGILSLGMFGYLGNLTLQMPLWLIFIDIVVLTILFLSSKKGFLYKDFANASCILFILEVLAAVTVMYIAWTPIVLGQGANISVGAQGRYFTPFIILLLPLIANTAKVGFSSTEKIEDSSYYFDCKLLVAMYLILFHYWGYLHNL